jgi:hypothetical protein
MPTSKPPRLWASADLDTVIARVAPEILALLVDSVPRTRPPSSRPSPTGIPGTMSGAR